MRFHTVSHWSLTSLLFKLSGDNVTVNVKKSLVGNRMGSFFWLEIGWAHFSFLVLFVGWLGSLVFLPHRKTYFS